mmetsp:Transcript_70891/g.112649  ORF Transcript_70891/g.112649 Transcript_70891/m.112649 type:complete len:131 (-) Transcript_70891:1649-2041(-)
METNRYGQRRTKPQTKYAPLHEHFVRASLLLQEQTHCIFYSHFIMYGKKKNKAKEKRRPQKEKRRKSYKNKRSGMELDKQNTPETISEALHIGDYMVDMSMLAMLKLWMPFGVRANTVFTPFTGIAANTI